jgi:hypothetical protein
MFLLTGVRFVVVAPTRKLRLWTPLAAALFLVTLWILWMVRLVAGSLA